MSTPVMPEDVAGELRQLIQDSSWEQYSQTPSFINKVYEVKEFSPGRLWEEVRVGVYDSELKERDVGGDLDFGGKREAIIALCKERFFERSMLIPMELFDRLATNSNAMGQIKGMLKDDAIEFAKAQIEAEETWAARLFNNGGLTAGDRCFNNTAKGSPADPGGDLLWDSKPFFNLSGNARTALSQHTYYNHFVADLTTTGLKTGHDLLQSTNAWTEMRRRMANRVRQLIVPVELGIDAFEVKFATGKAGTNENDANAYANLEIVEIPHLTDTNAWFLQAQEKACRWYRRANGALDIVPFTQKRSYGFSVQASFGAMVQNWRRIVGANLSTS